MEDKTDDELEAIIAVGKKAIQEKEARDQAKLKLEAPSYVGKCYKRADGISSHRYCKVLGVADNVGDHFDLITFNYTENHGLGLSPATAFVYKGTLNGWKLISEEEFIHAWTEICEKITVLVNQVTNGAPHNDPPPAG